MIPRKRPQRLGTFIGTTGETVDQQYGTEHNQGEQLTHLHGTPLETDTPRTHMAITCKNAYFMPPNDLIQSLLKKHNPPHVRSTISLDSCHIRAVRCPLGTPNDLTQTGIGFNQTRAPAGHIIDENSYGRGWRLG